MKISMNLCDSRLPILLRDKADEISGHARVKQGDPVKLFAQAY
jgi:hypothetical protein